MSTLERRIANLERVRTPEIVFVTYIGNPEPASLALNGKTYKRQTGETWEQFKERLERNAPGSSVALGGFTPGCD